MRCVLRLCAQEFMLSEEQHKQQAFYKEVLLMKGLQKKLLTFLMAAIMLMAVAAQAMAAELAPRTKSGA